MVDIKKFIDAAWSLVILQQYDERIINSVMDPAFISRFAAKYGSGIASLSTYFNFDDRLPTK